MEPTTDERTNGGGVVGSLAAEPEEPPAATKEGEGETERVSSEEKGEEEGEEKAPEPEKKKKRRSWFGSRGSRPSTSESRPGTGDKPKRRSFLSRFSRGSRASTPGEGEERPRSRDDDDTHTYTETIDDTAFDETTLDTEAYDLGVPSCRGVFTSFKRLVSISRCRGWFLF